MVSSGEKRFINNLLATKIMIKKLNHSRNIYNGIWKRVSNSIKKNLIANPSTTRAYSHVAKDFHDNQIPKVGSDYTC